MHRLSLKSLLLSGAVAAALALSGAAEADSLADALVKAYQTSPLLDSSRAALRGVDENLPQARSARRPQVGVSASLSSQTTAEAIEDQLYSSQASLNASLLVFDNGQTKAAIESARNLIAAGRADLKGIEQQVLFDAVEAYVSVRRDQEFVRLARNDVQRLDETLTATRNRFDVGEVTRTDVSQSESRAAASRSTLAAAEGQLAISRESYLAVVGSPADNLEAPPPLPQVPGTLDAATAIGRQRNPAIIAAQFNERVAVYDFDRALAAKGPQLAITAGVGIERDNQNIQGWDGNSFGQVGVEGSLPLYTGGRNDSLVRQAQALLDQRRFELNDSARQVVQSVGEAWAQLLVARASIVARREQVEAARIAAEGVAEEARLGARSTLDVLDADQERLEAEAEVVRALADEYIATYGLLQAMGLLTVEHLNLGIESYNPDVNFTRVRNGPSGGYDTSAVDRIRARWERR
ncbi:TolC family outer membrane protein [Amaricoccus sp.]|uniref:TolC family outer membrane protein n=1 Tax=Amaricoccus sp. TaxID=1872485 RepID=UPI002639A60A|nr:TolC family outer membrane protein [Amaricoccus sp.]HRO12310.1 TolC family outer membrane protein [Amaricoccus sp.]